MAGPGNTIPKPAEQRRRRNATVAMSRLPSEGRKGRTPPWPLPEINLRGADAEKNDQLNDREADLWREVWHTPQAVAWERLRWTHEVAQYVRWRVLAELGNIDAAK